MNARSEDSIDSSVGAWAADSVLPLPGMKGIPTPWTRVGAPERASRVMSQDPPYAWAKALHPDRAARGTLASEAETVAAATATDGSAIAIGSKRLGSWRSTSARVEVGATSRRRLESHKLVRIAADRDLFIPNLPLGVMENRAPRHPRPDGKRASGPAFRRA